MNRKRLTAFLLVAGLSISQVMMVSATDQSQESVSPTAEQGEAGADNTGTEEDKKNPSNQDNDQNSGSGNENTDPNGTGDQGGENGGSGNEGKDTKPGEGDSGDKDPGDGNSDGEDPGDGDGDGEDLGDGNSDGEDSGDGDGDGEAPDEGEDQVLEGTWILSGNRWWYRYSDNTYPRNGICNIEGTNYVFDADGWMKTGWHLDENTWYYFDGSGAMHKGWLLSGKTWYYLDLQDGKMYADGAYDIGADTYSFNGSGEMRTGWYLDDKIWYYFDPSGAMHRGWLLSGNTWYYLNPEDGKMHAGGNYDVGADTYSFYESGAMRTGWYLNDKIWYYFGGSGAMHKGWLLLGSTWYYLDPSDGTMHADGISEIKEAKYAFDKSGAMLTGWGQTEGDWYYYDGNGAQVKGWVYVGQKWYYLDPEDGKMFSNGMKEIKDDTYCFNKAGDMVVGWYQFVRSAEEDPDTGIKHKYNTWYYCTSSGAIKKGWLYLDEKWYYLDPEKGHMYEGNVYEIGGINYGFDKSGVMQTGWYDQTKTFTNSETGKTESYVVKYYFDSSGRAFHGWVSDNGASYWIDEKGVMVADGVYKVDKDRYAEFDADGKWLKWTEAPKEEKGK